MQGVQISQHQANLLCFLRAGFTGADLQNLMNEAAILAARRNLKEISKEEIGDALERIVAGPEKKGAVVSEAKKRLVAYHEVRYPCTHPHITFTEAKQAVPRIKVCGVLTMNLYSVTVKVSESELAMVKHVVVW